MLERVYFGWWLASCRPRLGPLDGRAFHTPAAPGAFVIGSGVAVMGVDHRRGFFPAPVVFANGLGRRFWRIAPGDVAFACCCSSLRPRRAPLEGKAYQTPVAAVGFLLIGCDARVAEVRGYTLF